jgi:ribosomal subunit interface protein
MNVTVSGKQINVGEALRTHIEKRLEDSVSKYLDRVTAIHVVIAKESHFFRTDITANTGTSAGLVIKATGESEDVYAACDEAASRIEKQLRRYKRRITNHHKTPTSEAVKAIKYVLPPTVAEEGDDDNHSGVVIAEKPTDVQKLTVGEAVMKMDLADLPALLFFNKANGRINVVYRRSDGNISWVDPEGAAA